ncbi:MAG: phosphoribosyltransferase [Candidatus Pacebacteria bacterium]|nr:phosphoribosyltransferase [Candidatus Paceibacterota bacterium]
MGKTIQKNELRQITYDEFGEVLRVLTDNVSTYCLEHEVSFDLVVPILRSGAITGMHLASKLHVVVMLPFQYKYEEERGLKKICEPPTLKIELPEKSHILVVDTNTVTGTTANQVISDVRRLFPLALISFATAYLDQSLFPLPNADQTFYGVLGNERRMISRSEAEKKGITNDCIVFPWQDVEEEWRAIHHAT